MMKKRSSLVTLVMGLVFILGFSTTARGGNFYAGKTLRFIVGYSPGGGYDTSTRLIARHIGKHIPGNPTPVVQNMPGAGALISAHYIYKRAKPDGLTIGSWNGGNLTLRSVLGDKRIKFKADKFGWLGAASIGYPTCGIMGFTGLKTLKDILKSKKRLKFGSTRSGSTNDVPKVINMTLGTNFDVIVGYGGTATIRIAMQRREIDAACWTWDSMKVTARNMLDAKGDDKFIPFLTHGDSKDPELRGATQLTDVVKDRGNLALIKGWSQQYRFQKPLTVPPGTPKDRLQILRRALKATLNDPELLAEAKRSKFIVDNVSGENVDKYIDELLAMSPESIEGLQFLISR